MTSLLSNFVVGALCTQGAVLQILRAIAKKYSCWLYLQKGMKRNIIQRKLILYHCKDWDLAVSKLTVKLEELLGIKIMKNFILIYISRD